MTTSADVRALMCANRQWSKLRSDEMRQLCQVRFIHPTARLIHELNFEHVKYGTQVIAPFAYLEWDAQENARVLEDDDYEGDEMPEGFPYFMRRGVK